MPPFCYNINIEPYRKFVRHLTAAGASTLPFDYCCPLDPENYGNPWISTLLMALRRPEDLRVKSYNLHVCKYADSKAVVDVFQSHRFESSQGNVPLLSTSSQYPATTP